MIRFESVYAVDGSGAARRKRADSKRPIYCLTPGDERVAWSGAPTSLLAFVQKTVLGSNGGPALLSVDVPLGLPEGFSDVYAGHASFVDWLLAQANGSRKSFVVGTVSDQRADAPFVDFAAKGDKARGHFPKRRCDAISGAESLYWCVGAKQVGKAALQFWFDVLVPLLVEHRKDVAVWPFEDVTGRKLVVAECYPGLITKRVWDRKVVKSSPTDVAEAIANSDDARDGTDERTRLHAASSEDDFDAFTICLAIRKALRDGVDILAAPEAARPHEGWILLLSGKAEKAGSTSAST